MNAFDPRSCCFCSAVHFPDELRAHFASSHAEILSEIINAQPADARQTFDECIDTMIARSRPSDEAPLPQGPRVAQQIRRPRTLLGALGVSRDQIGTAVVDHIGAGGYCSVAEVSELFDHLPSQLLNDREFSRPEFITALGIMCLETDASAQSEDRGVCVFYLPDATTGIVDQVLVAWDKVIEAWSTFSQSRWGRAFTLRRLARAFVDIWYEHRADPAYAVIAEHGTPITRKLGAPNHMAYVLSSFWNFKRGVPADCRPWLATNITRLQNMGSSLPEAMDLSLFQNRGSASTAEMQLNVNRHERAHQDR